MTAQVGAARATFGQRHLALYERARILARANGGRVAAQKRGVKFGPKPKLAAHREREVARMVHVEGLPDEGDERRPRYKSANSAVSRCRSLAHANLRLACEWRPVTFALSVQAERKSDRA